MAHNIQGKPLSVPAGVAPESSNCFVVSNAVTKCFLLCLQNKQQGVCISVVHWETPAITSECRLLLLLPAERENEAVTA